MLGWAPTPGAAPAVTWAFVLDTVDGRHTRLVVRVRGARGYPFYGLPPSIGMPFVRLGHFVMQRKQLLGIARRAESLASAPDEGTRTEAAWSEDGPRTGGTMLVAASHTVEGHVTRGFEAVREAFAENFARRGELGGACCAYRRGEKVVDLWGGCRNKRTSEPWERDTMVIVHSATKGLAAMTLAMAHSRGWLDYEERVCTYWPEFAQHGKERITVRQLLAHQAGLFAFDEPVDRSMIGDLDRLAVVLARQKPAWEPGTRQAYHALTLGFYESELLRRVDPRHRSLGQFFQDEIASPLKLDLYIRLPEKIPNARLATMSPPGPIKRLFGFPLRFAVAAMNPHSNIYRALVINPGAAVSLDSRRIYARNLEVPSGGAVGTARAIAQAYSIFATDGRPLGLRPETLELLGRSGDSANAWVP